MPSVAPAKYTIKSGLSPHHMSGLLCEPTNFVYDAHVWMYAHPDPSPTKTGSY
nr:12492_t:CDS:2 [Entrophospora candida]